MLAVAFRVLPPTTTQHPNRRSMSATSNNHARVPCHARLRLTGRSPPCAHRRMDSLMNLEPAMLLMIHSLPKYASLTVKLLEFLFHTVDTFDPPRREQLSRGVTTAMVRYCPNPSRSV